MRRAATVQVSAAHFIAILLSCLLADRANAQNSVQCVIDARQDVHPISRLIYGVNGPLGGQWANLTFTRIGGNRTTAYNWVTNASNAGNDYHFQSDGFFGGGSTPGGGYLPSIQNASSQNAGILITIPINGYVAADESGPVNIKDPARFTTRFKPELPAKNAPFSLAPDPHAPAVYQDEFVNWVKTKFPYGQSDPNRPIYFQLDNEPDIWAETHPEVHPNKVTYAELLQRSIAYSAAIKNVIPTTLVYGPVNYGYGGIYDLQQAPDANGRDFETFYLSGMASASAAAGHRLLDVLDIHWYPEATGGGVRITEGKTQPAVVAARLQAPRSLWDSTYTETSWITNKIHGSINLLPTLQRTIDRNFPDTRLSVSEYNYGGGSDISGAIAEADVLGIFGKLNVFSANEWPLDSSESFIAAAMAMYRNFDGRKATFGDTSVAATDSDPVNTSLYASVDSKNSGEMVIVAINKTAAPVTANFDIRNAQRFARADVYQLTSKSARPALAGQFTLQDPTHFNYPMPPMSVSTIHLTVP
jgi:hypothetical protein